MTPPRPRAARRRSHARGRHAALIVFVLAGTLALNGCAAARGANSDTTGERLLTYPGISDARVKLGDSMSGFTVSTSVEVTVSVAAGYSVTDASALLDWLFRTGWSVNNTKITSGVMVTVLDPAGAPLAWDTWPEALAEFERAASPYPAADQANYESSGIISVPAKNLEKLVGPWPGDIPDFPTDSLTKD